MNYFNLTPHPISVFNTSQFVNLQQVNAMTWWADGVDGDPILALDSVGNARISVSTKIIGSVDGVEFHATTYGDIIGLPDGIQPYDVLIVSLPTVSNAKASGHPLAEQMVSPFGVIRLASDTSIILGCQGFTY
jgi:hypothetical protein